MNKVSKIHPDTRSTRDLLQELEEDPELDQVMVVCFGKNGISTTRWSDGLNHGQLVFGSRQLEIDISNIAFPHRHDPSDIDY